MFLTNQTQEPCKPPTDSTVIRQMTETIAIGSVGRLTVTRYSGCDRESASADRETQQSMRPPLSLRENERLVLFAKLIHVEEELRAKSRTNHLYEWRCQKFDTRHRRCILCPLE